ncbi:MAG: ATP-binding protein, partial [Candidatus Electrothrix sp. AR3]|nr:ATP-binding protein [Candidatus Electrothrix sp. AR3]
VSGFCLIIGDYGSGKTFFLELVRSIAQEKTLVTANADLSPDRRIHASSGQARNLYSELMRNIATRSKSEGNALTSIVERFITTARQKSQKESLPVNTVIENQLFALTELVGGYDFAKVIEAYWLGHENDNDTLKSCAIRWLRAEYSTKTEARKDLGVRTFISDASFYDSLKLMSLFVRQAGYGGLLVNLDELVNLYKLNNKQARTSNYEQILRILNDCLQGQAKFLGFLLGGTPEFLLDPRRGLYSYEALQSRLAENTFAKQAGVIDYSSPAIHLANLSPEELYILLKNIRHVFAGNEEIPDQALIAFLEHCNKQIGEAYFRTPRNSIKAFVDMLSVIEQNEHISWQKLVGTINISQELNSDMPNQHVNNETQEELAGFTL